MFFVADLCCCRTREDLIYLPDGKVRGGGGKQKPQPWWVQKRNMIRLLTQTYENTNKRLWVTRDMRNDNELYASQMLQRNEDTEVENGYVIICSYNTN